MGDQGVEGLRVGQDPLHHLGIDDRPVGVGYIEATGLAHQADLGHAFALGALGGGAGRIDVDQFDVARAAQDEVHDRGLVDHRIGVGLQDDGGDAAGRGGQGRRLQGFLGLGAGLAGLHADVDQAGGQHRAARVDHVEVGRERAEIAALGDVGDLAVTDQQRAGAVPAAGGIDEAGVHKCGRALGHSSGRPIHFSTTGGT